ncbi:unnamed protein product [Effrenium voratum]|nr:unnamed protein product [Effrenium voratum]
MRRGSAIVDERIKQLERAKKLRQCRLRMRACVQWLKILFRKRHRDDCIEKCLVLLRQLGEWVRIRGALKQFMNHVKTIQRTMRDYLGMKRRRCYIIEKDWCRIEDLNLSVHAQHKAQNAMQDWQSKGRAKRRLFQAAVEASVSNKWKLIVDISSFRIPVAERRAVISAYHKRAIKRHMVIGKTFLQLVFDALKASRELDSFLNQFNYGGGSKSAVDSMSIKREDLVIDSAQDPNELSYWQMPEEGAKKGSIAETWHGVDRQLQAAPSFRGFGWWSGGPRKSNKKRPKFIRVGESLYRVQNYRLAFRRFFGRDIPMQEQYDFAHRQQHAVNLTKERHKSKAPDAC